METGSTEGVIDLVSRVRRMFDCGADPHLIAAHLSVDRRLAKWVKRRPGLRLPVAWDPFELTVRAILGQQVSVAAATTVSGRIAAKFGTALAGDSRPGLTHLFPTAARLADADLSGLGLTTRRAATVQGLAAPDLDLARHSERWRPWRAKAALHLWQSLSYGA